MLERPWQPAASNQARIQVLLEGSAMVTYIDGRIALSMRGYDHPGGQEGVFVSEGSAVFRNICGWEMQQ